MLDGKEQPALLAEAALALESFAYSRGVASIRYVVPDDYTESINALEARGLRTYTGNLHADGMNMLVYDCKSGQYA